MNSPPSRTDRAKLSTPAGTIIEGHEVVYKTTDVFLARTEAVRKVGCDSNIRIIEHNEFFFLAAGEIVCVQNPHSYVLHCHNLFEKKATECIDMIKSKILHIYEKHGLI